MLEKIAAEHPDNRTGRTPTLELLLFGQRRKATKAGWVLSTAYPLRGEGTVQERNGVG